MLDGMMDDDDGDGVRRRLRVDASKNWLAEWKGWWGDVWAAGSAWGMGQGVVAKKRALLEAWRRWWWGRSLTPSRSSFYGRRPSR